MEEKVQHFNSLHFLKSGRVSGLFSYPHFVQNPVNCFGFSQKMQRKSQVLWEKFITVIHSGVIHNL